jgi:hypothetical protein
VRGGQSGGVGRRVTRPGESGARCGGSPCLGQGGDVSVVELLGLDGVRSSRYSRADGVEEVDPLEGGDLDAVDVTPGPVAASVRS